MDRKSVSNKKRLEFTSLDKLLFPKDGISKKEVIEYYLKISPLFLKHIKNRPITLQRFPRGIEFPGFFQKHADFLPKWIKHVELPTKSDEMLYLAVNKKTDLGYLVNLNTIAFHSALSSIARINFPDVLIWDLDPSDGEFEKVIEVAFKLKTFLDEYNVGSLVKTTGSKGVHIYVPLDKKLPFDKIHSFSKIVANMLAKRFPKEITIAQRKAERKGRVLIDYVRNSYGQTAVSPYSLRGLPGAPVAAPILWEELGNTVLSSKQFNMHNILKRIKQKGEVWDNVRISNSHISLIVANFKN